MTIIVITNNYNDKIFYKENGDDDSDVYDNDHNDDNDYDGGY